MGPKVLLPPLCGKAAHAPGAAHVGGTARTPVRCIESWTRL